jgi:flagellin
MSSIIDGNQSFELAVGNGTASDVKATVSASVASGDLSGLIDAINAQSSKTGVTATYADGVTNAIVLTDADGDNVNITNLSTGTFSVQATNDDVGVVAAIAVAASNTVAGENADTVEIRGSVLIESSENFSIATTATTMGAALADLVSADGKTPDQSSAVLSSVASVDLTTQTGANSALSVVDNAIAKIDAIRSGLGAVQNRFESTISNLQNVSENISAARSRILDADFAAETANLTKSQILQQAGVAMLSQANQLPQVALSLLQ